MVTDDYAQRIDHVDSGLCTYMTVISVSAGVLISQPDIARVLFMMLFYSAL